jgi:hypothetical protein
LHVAAKQGKFRWHIDPDGIDCKHPLYPQRRQAAAD